MAWDISDIAVGDEVTVTVTILKLLDEGRASVSIPYYGFPHSVRAPKRVKAGDKLDLTGTVMRIDVEDRKITVDLPARITIGIEAVTGWEPAPHRDQTPPRDIPD